MKIAQVNTHDIYGGAAMVAWNLHRAYLEMGFESRIVARHRESADPSVIEAPSRRRDGLAGVRAMAAGLVDSIAGIEDFNFPWTGRLLDMLPWNPDILQFHNLHGGYFDLRALPGLSKKVPVVLTLHDAWLTTGHCAHSFGCGRWTAGCGQCPDLTIHPAVNRDMTAYNWRRKRDIFGRCRLYVCAPSQWLMERVVRSILAPAIIEARVIPNGVDLSVFRRKSRREARGELGLPADAHVLLFAATGLKKSIWKDYRTLREAVSRVARRLPGKVVFLAAGDEGPPETAGSAEVRFLPYQPPAGLVRYYQAADIYVHAARADTFPNVVIEALATGTPVVATAVGGIPEQIRALGPYGPSEATGVLVPEGDPEAMAGAVVRLLEDKALLDSLSANAEKDARARFGLKAQSEKYARWFMEILAQKGA